MVLDDRIYQQIVNSRTEIVKCGLLRNGLKPAGVFHPYIGEALCSSGGIYFVGKATRGSWYSDQIDSTAEEAIKRTISFIDEGLRGELGNPFWCFCNQLVIEAFGSSLITAKRRWGWSNLLKVGAFSEQNDCGPDKWGPEMVDAQRASCICALKFELSLLRNSVVYVGSAANNFGIVYEIKKQNQFERSPGVPEDAGTYEARLDHNNIVVYGPHPRAIPAGHQRISILDRLRHLLAERAAPR